MGSRWVVLLFNGEYIVSKSIFKLEKGFSLDFKGYGWEDLELGYRFHRRDVPLLYLKMQLVSLPYCECR